MLGGGTATIDDAVSVLNVPHVLICEHTNCGVMKGLLHPDIVVPLPAVRNWMAQAATTRRIGRAPAPALARTTC